MACEQNKPVCAMHLPDMDYSCNRFEALSSSLVPTNSGVTRLDAVKWVLPARQVLVGGQMDAHVEMAQALVCEQEYSRALETLARVPEALGKPSNASLTTLETKARALAGLGRHQESLQVIDQLITALKSTGDEDKNRVAEACCSRGVVLASMVAHDAALESFKEARLLCPGESASPSGTGTCALHRDGAADAVNICRAHGSLVQRSPGPFQDW
jgi:tetratricopeptide (TPR) repeat protein